MEGATLFAPIIGGYIQYYYGWRMNFIFFTILCIISFAIVLIFLQETNTNRTNLGKSKLMNKCLKIMKERNFLIYTLASMFATSGVYIFMSVSSFVFINNLSLSVVQYGYILFLSSTTLVAGGFINSKLIVQINFDSVIFVGAVLMCLSGVMLAIPILFSIENIVLILVSSLLFILGAALIFPNALAGALNDYSEMVGTAASLYGTCQLVGAFVCTSLFSLIGVNSLISLAMANIILGVMTFTVFYLKAEPAYLF